MSETAKHGFTPEQLAWLEKRFNSIRPVADRGFDRATIMWITGGLTALGVAVSGVLYAEISSVRDLVQANTASLARIEAILNERLPSDR